MIPAHKAIGGEISPVALRTSSKKKIVFVFMRSGKNTAPRYVPGARVIECCEARLGGKANVYRPPDFYGTSAPKTLGKLRYAMKSEVVAHVTARTVTAFLAWEAEK